ncbi:serum paraoxonase/arylesterase 1 [Danio rerio]|uniref:Paraoxonase n=1 Tax=Danio rerio TaxID=7955 RepID=Q66JN5_DANRE|nr:serum paraoxonase/arylesterase 1 [Danio rerio]AAH80844.1 Zgc:91887 [Danio rerio]AAI64584.1 Zgc:91887 protein [Danio rerio]|eukprot:NP_001004542.1 paraoxonase 1 [Danio rerio]
MGKLAVLSLAVVALAVFIGERLVTLRHVALSYRELTQNYLPNCHLIKGIECGSEDITIIDDGLAFLSTGVKAPGLPFCSDDPGKIYTLNLLDSEPKIKALSIKGDFDQDTFNPHGISVYTDDKDGTMYLFVINHPRGNSQVEIFEFVKDEHALKYIKTIEHELLHSVNDIVAVGTESFYATNDHYFSNEILKIVENFFTLPWCDVIYYSPETVQVVADGFLLANGINLSLDKRYLYVSDVLKHTVTVLEIKKNTVLSRVKEINVGSLADNIELDRESGDLWIGCHPNGFKFMLGDPNDPPGSEVIKIENIHSEKPLVTQVYSDNGSVIIGSSVAAPYRGKVLIGTVYHKVLLCDRK